MAGHKAIAAFLSSILLLSLFSLVMNLTSETTPQEFIMGIFSDIYTHANSPLQTEVYEKLVLSCASVGRQEDLKNEYCTDEKIQEIKTQCAALPAERPEPMQEEDYLAARKFCGTFNEETFKKECERAESIDKNKLSAYCSGLTSEGWSREEAFSQFLWMSTAPGSENEEYAPKKLQGLLSLAAMSSSNTAVTFWGVLAGACLLLICLFLYHEPKELAMRLSRTFTELGAFLCVPFILIWAYVTFIGIDTSFILDSVLHGTAAPPVSRIILTIIPLSLARMYTITTIITGSAILLAGISGYVLSTFLLRYTHEKSPPADRIK